VATTRRFVPVSPQAIWSVLADARTYADWVVGSKGIDAVDAAWPAAGAKFHHAIGWGPLTLSDDTTVLESRRPRLLRLRAKGRPLGTATVTLRLTGRRGGTMVEMHERPDGIYAPLALNPLLELLTRIRNAESLARLDRLARVRGG
jgi:polyketide cyclase/dehydrase/lipid transport protein